MVWRVPRDGLLDVVIGAMLAALNTGSATEPAFGVGATTSALPVGVVTLLQSGGTATAASPGLFVDLDNDGDLDFLDGLENQAIHIECVCAAC